jgi:hypothetical protein
MEGENFNFEYYDDKNVEAELSKAADYLRFLFGDELRQIEFLKLRQIGREIQEQKAMKAEDTRNRPMNKEIVSRFIFDSYGVDMAIASDMVGNDPDKIKAYVRKLRQDYMNEQ